MTKFFNAEALAYMEALYEDYLQDPSQVDASFHAYFEGPDFLQDYKDSARTNPQTSDDALRYLNLACAYRAHGHLIADIDPLGLQRHPVIPNLELSYHGLAPDSPISDDSRALLGHLGQGSACAGDVLSALKRTYSAKIGAELGHLQREERAFLAHKLEAAHALDALGFDASDFTHFGADLASALGLERHLEREFAGAKRFSLEGLESCIVFLNHLLECAQDVDAVCLGMAHRGRLNVLVNVLGKAPADVFDEFLGKAPPTGTMGDVKYHLGMTSRLSTGALVSLAPNPSHLELVTPFVLGQARALHDVGQEALPVILHGDSAVAVQGVVLESLQMADAPAYQVGGSIHLILNNQVGFTTVGKDARTSHYASDAFKTTSCPILHVNAHCVLSVALCAKIALLYRRKFAKDIVIDLIGYRKHGHNETDDPALTQVRMYQAIRQQTGVYHAFANRYLPDADAPLSAYTHVLQQTPRQICARLVVAADIELDNTHTTPDIRQDAWGDYAQTYIQAMQGLKAKGTLAKIVRDRTSIYLGDRPLDFGSAESLLYASLLEAGVLVRLCGEETPRGTFSHRHAIMFDQISGDPCVLPAVFAKDAPFYVYNSVLSEEAALCFEYGYSVQMGTQRPALVLWEAQFGDFVNGAQAVIDQYIAAGTAKWGIHSNLILWLPHGYEGQGAEHSSARLERFLLGSAKGNWRVIYPTTPAQLIKAMRRQVIDPVCPLVIMGPKSLLRNPMAMSSLDDLAGDFLPIIADSVPNKHAIKRLILCSGKVYFDLKKAAGADVVLARLESLYPLDTTALNALAQDHPNARVFWVQEEPLNQGAWAYLAALVCPNLAFDITPIARPPASAPATGLMRIHEEEQQDLIQRAFYKDSL